MRRLIALLALLFLAGYAPADTIRVTTWNMEWFPSGSPNLASPEIEAARIKEAARVLTILNPDVMLLQEIRDQETCEKLVEAMKPLTYQVIICSRFRESVGGVLGRQQIAILAKHSAEAAWAEPWKALGTVDPPRGFAFALIPFNGKDIAFYSLHLKSNLVRGNSEREVEVNILKRELSAEQVVAHAEDMHKKFPSLAATIVGGDFNTNRDQEMFVSEKSLTTFENAGFRCDYLSLPLAQRVTHPGKGGYPDCTFDYLFAEVSKATGQLELLDSLISDHRPATLEIRVP